MRTKPVYYLKKKERETDGKGARVPAVCAKVRKREVNTEEKRDRVSHLDEHLILLLALYRERQIDRVG